MPYTYVPDETAKNGRYGMDGFLTQNLDHLKKELKKDYDCFIVVSGREGYGKSTLAGQIAKYLDPSYNLDRCCFTADQFENAVYSAGQYQAIVFDETMGYLGSRGAMSKFNKKLIKIFSEMRSRNLIIILCITSFFELDTYPAVWRSTVLIDTQKRGFFRVWNYEKKQKLYWEGKKKKIYCVAPQFYGRFGKHIVYDKEEYEKKKRKASRSWEIENNRERKLFKHKKILIRIIYDNLGWSQKKIGEKLGETQQHIGYLLEDSTKGGSEGEV